MAINMDCKCGAKSMLNFGPSIYVCSFCRRAALLSEYPNHSGVSFPLWLLLEDHIENQYVTHGSLEDTLQRDRHNTDSMIQGKADGRHCHHEYAESHHYHYKNDIHNLG